MAGANKTRNIKHANMYNGLPNRIEDFSMHMLSAKAPYSFSLPIPHIRVLLVLAQYLQFNESAKRVPTFIGTFANPEKPSCLHICFVARLAETQHQMTVGFVVGLAMPLCNSFRSNEGEHTLGLPQLARVNRRAFVFLLTAGVCVDGCRIRKGFCGSSHCEGCVAATL